MAYESTLHGRDYRLAPGWTMDVARFLRGHFGARDKRCLVAEVDGELAGYLLASVAERPRAFRDRRYGHVSDLFVAEAQRQRGVGAALVEEACRWFASRRIRRVQLLADAKNVPGIAFWRRMGFETAVLTMDKHL